MGIREDAAQSRMKKKVEEGMFDLASLLEHKCSYPFL